MAGFCFCTLSDNTALLSAHLVSNGAAANATAAAVFVAAPIVAVATIAAAGHDACSTFSQVSV